MPPAMTSARGGSGSGVATRSASTSGMSSNGTVPRREPLRRLYPIQRARTVSDSVREVSGFGDENTPIMNPVGAAVAMVENHKDATMAPKRRAQRLVFVGSSTGNSGGSQRNAQAVGRTMSNPDYTSHRVPRRYSSSASERSGSVERVPTYQRPSLIRRSSDVGSQGTYSSTCPVHGDTASSSSKTSSRQGSILKRPNSSRSSVSSASSHRGSRSGDFNSAVNHKQVQFCPNVSVVQIDEEGEHLSTHFQELNGEKRKRLGTLSRNSHGARTYDNVIYITDDLLGLQDINKSGVHEQRRASVDSHLQGSGKQAQLARDGRFTELFKRLNNGTGTMRTVNEQMEDKGLLKKGQFDITFSNRPGELTKLRFVLHMGQDYNPNDLVVKANTTGSRIRVLATRTDRTSRLTEEFNEKYMLPMDIDPYEIEARLDKWGNLTVEAPLLTLDKRAEVNKTNNVLCAVYV